MSNLTLILISVIPILIYCGLKIKSIKDLSEQVVALFITVFLLSSTLYFNYSLLVEQLFILTIAVMSLFTYVYVYRESVNSNKEFVIDIILKSLSQLTVYFLTSGLVIVLYSVLYEYSLQAEVTSVILWFVLIIAFIYGLRFIVCRFVTINRLMILIVVLIGSIYTSATKIYHGNIERVMNLRPNLTDTFDLMFLDAVKTDEIIIDDNFPGEKHLMNYQIIGDTMLLEYYEEYENDDESKTYSLYQIDLVNKTLIERLDSPTPVREVIKNTDILFFIFDDYIASFEDERIDINTSFRNAYQEGNIVTFETLHHYEDEVPVYYIYEYNVVTQILSNSTTASTLVGNGLDGEGNFCFNYPDYVLNYDDFTIEANKHNIYLCREDSQEVLFEGDFIMGLSKTKHGDIFFDRKMMFVMDNNQELIGYSYLDNIRYSSDANSNNYRVDDDGTVIYYTMDYLNLKELHFNEFTVIEPLIPVSINHFIPYASIWLLVFALVPFKVVRVEENTKN